MKSSEQAIIRCGWCGDDPLYQKYHDEEWGRPCFDDKKLFEFITLEGAQAGLSWITVLRKREGYRQAFADYDLVKISKFSEKKILSLKENPNIIRNEGKIRSTVSNAKAALILRDEHESLANYFWSFVDNKPIQNHWQTLKQVPANTELSDRIAKDMKARGFKFFGTTICYAFLQAMGLVNDHVVSCFAHADCAKYKAK